MGYKHETKYFNWLCDLVYDRNSKTSYNKLLKCLHDKEFTWTMVMDENRALDGIELRDRFVDLYPYAEIDFDKPCSMLEMMVALAERCEDHIMSNDRYGNRTGEWFWNMILSLGLTKMFDENFDRGYVDEVLFIFDTRQYAKDGKGSLFAIDSDDVDMRNIEIWYQMNRYLEEVPE